MSSLSDGWERLDDNREINLSSHIPLVRPVQHDGVIPLDCPVCLRMLRDHVDVSSYEKTGCCDPCALKWAQPNRKKWDDGWRPDRDEIESFLDSLKKLPTYIVR